MKKVFCCDGIKGFISNNERSPLYCIDIDKKCMFYGYYFGMGRIRYCPSCGFLLTSDLDLKSPECYQHPFCCLGMDLRIEDAGDDWFQVFYQPFTRRYFFALASDARELDQIDKVYEEWDFQYCIDCGRKLPEPLLDLWLKTVKEKFGVEQLLPLEKMLPLLPEEFQTDLWWKNRGL